MSLKYDLKRLKSVPVVDALWLLALGIFVLAGAPLVSFHGDETNHIYNSHDYSTAFIDGQPLDLVIDFSQPPNSYHLRLSDSSVARYAIGLAWHLAGLSESDLPSRGWNWQLTYDANLEDGLRPAPRLLTAARLSQSVFLALSSAVMFGLGWQFGKRPLAYLVSAIYTFNPVILLNGRRAIQEGSLLFFGMLTILIAVIISRKRATNENHLLRWWLALIVASGLAFASKNSAVLYVAPAFAWIFVAQLIDFRIPKVVNTGLILLLCGVTAIGLLVLLSPGLWGDPFTGLREAAALRLRSLSIHTRTAGGVPPIAERVSAIASQPYMTPVWHYELNYWGRIPQIKSEIDTYMASPLSGIQYGRAIGLPLTALAVLGLVMLFSPPPRADIPLYLKLGLVLWLAVNVLAMVVNTVLWQRYFIALIPIYSLLSGLGLLGLVRILKEIREQLQYES